MEPKWDTSVPAVLCRPLSFSSISIQTVQELKLLDISKVENCIKSDKLADSNF